MMVVRMLRRRKWRLAGWLAAGTALALVAGAFREYAQVEREEWLSSARVEQLRAAVTKNPRDRDLLFWFSYRLTQSGQNAEAKGYMEQLVREYPRSQAYWIGLARTAAGSGDPIRADEAYRKALELNPRSADFHFTLARMYTAAKLDADAVRLYEEGSRLGPASAAALASWAQSLFSLDRPAEAWDLVHRSVTMSPRQDDPYLLLGRLAEVLGRRAEAEPILRRRMEMTRAYPVGVARAPLARLLVQGHPDAATLARAEALGRRAVKDQSPTADFDAALGMVLMAKGDNAGARRALEQGLRRRPEDEECLRLLAEVSERQGDKRESERLRARLPQAIDQDPAVRELRRRVAAAPKDAGAQLALASALRAAKQPARAVEVCLQALREAPRDPELSALLAACRTEALQTLAGERAGAVPNLQVMPWADG
jgi:predicted Zn-dependent protease